jgi:hypothetical protein
MKIFFFCFIALISIFTSAESFGSASQLNRYDDKSKIYSGKLGDSAYAALNQYLTTALNSKPKDSIIIKYDYNNDTCWNILDKKSAKHIKDFVRRRKERVQQVLATRHNVSVFNFREPGNNLNKIKKWDNSILIDSSKQLYNLIFIERCTCGNSIIVMPDKRFVFMRSDPHLEVLNLTQKQIEKILSKN